MKYTPRFPPGIPAKPYPPQTYQYTRCLLAVAVIRTFCEEVRPQKLPAAIQRRISSISKRLAQVSASMTRPKNKDLSAGAKRDLDAAFHLIADRCTVKQMMDGEADILHWYDAIYLAHLLLADCRATCPVYYKGESWGWLYHHVECLADYLEAHYPGTADTAGDIHMEVAA